MKIIGISTSPRAGGNTYSLLQHALDGAKKAGADIRLIDLRNKNIAPCDACMRCSSTGHCHIEDDFQDILRQMLDSDRMIFSTPVYFLGVCAQAKCLIDRCQCIWASGAGRKKENSARAMVIAAGGARGKKMFESIGLVMKYWTRLLEFDRAPSLYVSGVDEKGAVMSCPRALNTAESLGRELAGTGNGKGDKDIFINCGEDTESS